ncbi:unnamed protein product [Euphydryas editha]|uniref:Uncharacterized protein n=1 Tax=Euphydryas editha TaxID=104508 RepID=A0AAU9UIU1_EUPED|nr:unnamed protein product [Euphydryas editha]
MQWSQQVQVSLSCVCFWNLDTVSCRWGILNVNLKSDRADIENRKNYDITEHPFFIRYEWIWSFTRVAKSTDNKMIVHVAET